MKNALRNSATLLFIAATMSLAQAASAEDFTARLNAPDSRLSASEDGLNAQSAALDHNWKDEALLAAKAYREDPTVLNEFNLATGLQHTGRTTLAIPLYQDVAARGQDISVQALYDYRHAPYVAGAPRRIDSTLGQEAARRLDAIAGRPAPFNR